MVAAANKAYGSVVTMTPAPTAGFPRGDARVLRDGDSNWITTSAEIMLRRGHDIQEAGANTGWQQAFGSTVVLVVDEGSAQVADHLYVIGYWGSNAIHRPVGAKLEWSDDNSAWTTVEDNTGLTQGGQPGAGRAWIVSFDTAGLSHRYWRITLTSGGTTGNTWLFVSGVLHGSEIVSRLSTLTFSAAPSGTYPALPVSRLLAGEADWNGTTGAQINAVATRKLINDTFVAMIGRQSTAGQTWTITMDNLAAVPARRLMLKGYTGDNLIEAPRVVTIQWSDDNSAWTTVESKTLTDQGQPGGRLWWYLCDISAAGAHRYWRATMEHGNEWIHVAAFELWGAEWEDIALARMFTISPAADGNFPNTSTLIRVLPGESDWSTNTGGSKLTHGNPAYWGDFATAVGWALDSGVTNGGNARLDLGSAQAGDWLVVTGIHGNGANMKTPEAVILSYSDDDSAFTDFFTKTGLTSVQDAKGNWAVIADISAQGSHRYWRARVRHTSATFFVALGSIEFFQNQVPDPQAVTMGGTFANPPVFVAGTISQGAPPDPPDPPDPGDGGNRMGGHSIRRSPLNG